MTDSLSSKILVGFLLFVTCLGVGYFFTAEQWTNYKATKSLLAQKQAIGQELKDSLALAQQFVQEFNSKSAEVPTVNLALPAKDADLSNLIFSLGELAKSSGLALANFSVSDIVPVEGQGRENTIQAQKVSLDASGSYASFKDFILRLQNSARIMDVDQITAKADDSGQVEYQITLRTYFQK